MSTQQPWHFHVLDVIRVVDGDTYDLLVDVGFRLHAVQRFRLRGVDTPEIYGVGRDTDEYQRGQDAKQVASDWLRRHVDHGLTVVCYGETSFARWVADIQCAMHDTDLGSWLVGAGHAQVVDE